jgi:diaminopimelate epimerase
MRLGLALDVVKMHGAHNTFGVIDDRPAHGLDFAGIARALCAPEGPLGGADGILVVGDAPGFAASMHVFNADGSEAEMCGNGVRCVVRYLAERGAGDAFVVATPAGPIGAEVVAREPAFVVRVDIGPVTFANDCVPERLDVDGRNWTFYDASVGNPHAVLLVDDPAAIDLVALGRSFAKSARYPNGTNVHLAHAVDATTLDVRHFERGVGLTQACGTGAVACAAVARRVLGMPTPVTVRVPGGTLRVDWETGATARLTGPAETLFARTIDL